MLVSLHRIKNKQVTTLLGPEHFFAMDQTQPLFYLIIQASSHSSSENYFDDSRIQTRIIRFEATYADHYITTTISKRWKQCDRMGRF